MFRTSCVCLLLSLLAAGDAVAAALPPLTLHVGVEGNDDWSGQSATPAAADGPFHTLLAAQRAARKALAERRATPGSGGVTVVIHPGIYTLDQPWEFEPADSGTPEQPMVYRAAQPGTVTISGGRVLQPAARVVPGEAGFAAPALDEAFWAGGPQLYVNGRRAVLAREPKLGTDWFAGQAVAVAGEPATAVGHQAFRAPPAALAYLQRLDATDRARALLEVMQSWSNGRHRLAPDAPEGTVRVTPRSRWPFLFFGTNQRFHVENVAAALDQPGEWIGSTHGVRYLLRAGEAQPAEAVLPMLDQWVIVRGAGAAGPYVQSLELRDLGFAFSRALTPPAGWVDTQAAVDIGAGIQVDQARGFVLSGCHIAATGGYGVWLREGVRDSKVEGCTMQDLGAGGVKVGLPAQPPGADTGTGHNTVSHNRIAQTGKQFPGAVGVWVGQSFDNEISHNTITDTTYSAISVGWQWGYGTATSGRNRIVGNALLRIGSGAMADLGGIYTLGPAPGTVIADNLIREVRGYHGHGAGAWGIYNDEGSSDLRVENNVVVGTDSGAYHLNTGRNLVVERNLFAQGDEAEIRVSRSDPARTRLLVSDNLLVTASVHPMDAFAHEPDAAFRGNQVAPLQAGTLPDLLPCAGGCSTSTAKLQVGPGPQQISLRGADAVSAKRWADTAATAGAGVGARTEALAAAVAVASPAAPAAGKSLQGPPLELALDLDSVRDGGRPAGWRYMPPTPVEAFQTVSDASAPGKRCLQLNDSALFAQRYEPYMFAPLNHVRGISTARFSVHIDEQAELIHEWRDDSTPYRTGPSVRITRLGVEAGGRIVAPAPPGTWLNLRISAPVGGAGIWQLQVIDSDGKVYRADNLPPKTPGWKALRWLGFIANAATTSATCLAAVKVANDAP